MTPIHDLSELVQYTLRTGKEWQLYTYVHVHGPLYPMITERVIEKLKSMKRLPQLHNETDCI